ncbi:hypothetical protein Nepgr_012068 [Nepenthes gracilis]|uniref:Pre-rRNA-processing protein RIX1 N-terminal domain-containing protein n=1 Tax=Nepenthes gracilis TaxID=150966 RepID=A0AAD3XMI5_NEPGR|nr:hypothetical protein Nepgr_012068 [Nepenthes gracilis]
MAAFDHFHDMYDVALKPRLLRTLLEEQVPDEKQPFRNPSVLSSVVSIIKTHGLLSESFYPSIDKGHLGSWKSAVDDWVDRILKLVSSNMPDKCWAGICLLGVTCSECSTSRFLASYSAWFNELLSHIQLSSGSQFVKVASCASTSDLLTRLGGSPNVKKDGTSHAGKLVQPILKLLNEDHSEAACEAGAYLLSIIITVFPSSVHRFYNNVEDALVSKIMTGNCTPKLLKKLACCLALLPKSRGDEESWCLMMQKILLSISSQLNEALEGLEEESKHDEAIALLVPAGKSPHHPIRGSADCSSTMLTSSFPVRVIVPVPALLAMVRRVLLVDGSLPRSLLSFTTAMQQEFICSQLPVLHLYSLEVLAAVVKGISSQLLPHAADIVRLLTEYLKRCRFSELRIKVYSIIKVLLISMGVGIVSSLSQELINGAFVDLNPADGWSSVTSPSVISHSSGEATLRPHRGKRKHTTLFPEEKHNTLCLELEESKDSSTLMAVKIAALGALEALLTVGSALGNDNWRSSIDKLLITLTTDACRRGWAHDEATWADFQHSALRALLASLLAPARVRPPYLAQGLDIFRKGKQATGTKVAEFCTHALLALEVLIHPRVLPLVDFPSPSMKTFGGQREFEFGGRKQNFPSRGGMLGMDLGGDSDADDYLNEIYLENVDGNVSMASAEKAISLEGKKNTYIDQNAERPSHILVDESTDRKAEPKDTSQKPPSSITDVTSGRRNCDEMMLVPEHFNEPIQRPEELSSRRVGGSLVAERQYGKPESVGDGDTLHLLGTAPSDRDLLAAMDISVENAVADADTLKPSQAGLDNDSSSDPFPDIVDGDPDSD